MYLGLVALFLIIPCLIIITEEKRRKTSHVQKKKIDYRESPEEYLFRGHIFLYHERRNDYTHCYYCKKCDLDVATPYNLDPDRWSSERAIMDSCPKKPKAPLGEKE